MSIEIFQIDAFSSLPFKGNPACVCFLEDEKDIDWMQSVAAEMNLSETAFLRKSAESGPQFEIRWFTPFTEVDLCGHATLASAHALWETGEIPKSKSVIFQSRSGKLTADLKSDGIQLDFPAKSLERCLPPEGLTECLGVVPTYCGTDGTDYLLELESESCVREVSPDFQRLSEVSARGIVITGQSDGSRFDFVSRFFGPAVGINEDPVTGSAHCLLGPFWSEKLAKNRLSAFQASKRGGEIQVELVENRVKLTGHASLVFRGQMMV